MMPDLELGGCNDGCVVWNGLYAIGLLVVLVSALWPFADALGFYFAKSGIEEMLVSARIASPADLGRILTQPVLSGVRADAIYYRPVSTLSLSLDFALWEYGARGYHALDLLLHAAVAGFLFHLAYVMSDRYVWIGLVSGLLYTLHPITVEVVPAVAHRQQTLMAVFLLIGLIASFHHSHRDGGGGWLMMALASFLLSVGAKETGIIFLPLVLTHLLLYDRGEGGSWGTRISGSLRRWLPYVGTGAAYVLWWGWVTRARAFVGGGTSMQPPILRRSILHSLHLQLFVYPPRIFPRYFEALLAPVWYFPRSWFGSLPGASAAVPWALPHVLVVVLSGIFLLGAGLVVWFDPPSIVGGDRKGDGRSGSGELASVTGFAVVWLFVPVLFFSVTNAHPSPKRSYAGLLPLSLLVGTAGLAAVRVLGVTVTDLYARRFERMRHRTTAVIASAVAVVLVGGFYALSTAFVSPLARNYPTWQHSHDLNRHYYRALFRELRKLPPGSDLRLVGVPRWVGQREPFPRVGTVALLLRPEPMLQWRFSPHRFGEIRWSYRDVFDPASSRLELNTRRLGSHDYAIVTRMGQGAG